jgi:hypothetical protein
MDVEELRALSRTAEPLPAASVCDAPCECATAYNDLLARFRERLTLARNGLVRGEPVEGLLADELRLLSNALPEMRQRAVTRAQGCPRATAKGA